MHILTPLVIGLFAIHSHAVLHEATDLKDFDFIPFQKVERYREYEKSRGKIEFQDDQRCPCGKELLNAMILVYFDQYGRNGTVKKSLRPRRFLVSQQQMGSGAFARVYHGTPLSDTNVPGECIAIKRPASLKFLDNHGHGIEQIKKEAKLLAKFTGAKHVIKMKHM